MRRGAQSCSQEPLSDPWPEWLSSCPLLPPGSPPQLDFCELHLSSLLSPTSLRFLSHEEDRHSWVAGPNPKSVLILQMRKPRLREGKQRIQGHTAETTP